MGNWCILRTSGAKTLPLATSLAKAGFEVWTPREIQTRRRPRSKITMEREHAIAPTFVFARSGHLPMLAIAADSPVSPFPAFSIFHYAGRIPLIGDSDVAGFRDAEERAHMVARKAKRRKLVMGQRVSLTEGAYAGMSGVIEQGDGQFAVVAFAGGLRMKVASWLLHPNDICGNDHGAMSGAAA